MKKNAAPQGTKADLSGSSQDSNKTNETKPKKRGRQKGCVKTGGRKAGTPNKTTQQRRELVQMIVDRELDYFLERLPKLEDKDRLQVLKMLIPYALGKSVPQDTETKEKLQGKVFTLNLSPPKGFRSELP